MIIIIIKNFKLQYLECPGLKQHSNGFPDVEMRIVLIVTLVISAVLD